METELRATVLEIIESLSPMNVASSSFDDQTADTHQEAVCADLPKSL